MTPEEERLPLVDVVIAVADDWRSFTLTKQGEEKPFYDMVAPSWLTNEEAKAQLKVALAACGAQEVAES